MRISDWSSDVCSSDLMLENIRYGAVVERLVDMARQHLGASALENDDIGQRLAQLRAEVTAVRAMTYRIASRAAIAPPGSEASLARAFFSQLQQRIRRKIGRAHV